MSAAHYTAVIEVSKTTPEERKTSRNPYEESTVTPREVAEVARLVLRADTLDELKTRVVAHVELVAE